MVFPCSFVHFFLIFFQFFFASFTSPCIVPFDFSYVCTYHHPDHLSNRAETDATGAPDRTFGHFPYGEAWYETGTADKLKYTTYERDSGIGESGLDYAMFRHYNSGEGRFMTVDLVAGDLFAPQSLNRYSYVTGDPVNLFDPLGLCGIVTTTETSTSPNGKKTTTKTVKDEGPCASGAGNSGGCGGPCGGGDNGGRGGGGGKDPKAKTCIFIAGLLPDTRNAVETALALAKAGLAVATVSNALQGTNITSVAVGISGGGSAGANAGAISVGLANGGSLMVGTDITGASGLLISVNVPTLAAMQTLGTNSWNGGYAANFGASVLVSPKTLDDLAGGSGGVQGAVGPYGLDIGSNGIQFTAGLGAGSRVGGSPSLGPTFVIHFCD